MGNSIHSIQTATQIQLLLLFEARHTNHNFSHTNHNFNHAPLNSVSYKTIVVQPSSFHPLQLITFNFLLHTITRSYSKSTLLVHLLKHQVLSDLHLRVHLIYPEKQLVNCLWRWWGHLFPPAHLGRQSLHSPHQHCSID